MTRPAPARLSCRAAAEQLEPVVSTSSTSSTVSPDSRPRAANAPRTFCGRVLGATLVWGRVARRRRSNDRRGARSSAARPSARLSAELLPRLHRRRQCIGMGVITTRQSGCERGSARQAAASNLPTPTAATAPAGRLASSSSSRRTPVYTPSATTPSNAHDTSRHTGQSSAPAVVGVLACGSGVAQRRQTARSGVRKSAAHASHQSAAGPTAPPHARHRGGTTTSESAATAARIFVVSASTPPG